MSDFTHIRVDNWSISQLNGQILAFGTPFILLTDSKVSFSDLEISELLNLMKQDSRIAIIQPKVRVSETNFIHSFGGTGGFTDRLGVGYTRGAAFGESEQDSEQFDKQINKTDWIFAPVMLIRREAFEQACGLDLSFTGQSTWMDLGARLRGLGYELRCYAHLVVSYPQNSQVSDKTTTSSLHSTVQYVIRHIEGPWLLVALMWILLEIVFIPGNVVQFRFKLVSSRLKALYNTLKLVPGLIRDRYIIQEGIEKARKYPVSNQNSKVFSIFWSHFARLGKTASNLLTIFLVIASVFSLTMRDRR